MYQSLRKYTCEFYSSFPLCQKTWNRMQCCQVLTHACTSRRFHANRRIKAAIEGDRCYIVSLYICDRDYCTVCPRELWGMLVIEQYCGRILATYVNKITIELKQCYVM